MTLFPFYVVKHDSTTWFHASVHVVEGQRAAQRAVKDGSAWFMTADKKKAESMCSILNVALKTATRGV